MKFVLYIFLVFGLSISSISFGQKSKSFAQKQSSTISRHAQLKKDAVWNFDKNFSVNLSQNYFLNSSSGGESLFGINFDGEYNASYKRGKLTFLNYGKYEIGFTKIGREKFVKSNDLITITSDVGFKVFKNTMFGLLVDWVTQSAPSYLYPENDSIKISDFMSPGFLTAGLGFTYHKSNKFSFFISPAAFHTEFVKRELGEPDLYSMPNNSKVYNSVGALLKTNFNGDVTKNVHIRTSLELYSNFLRTPENIEVYFPTTIQLKVNEYISVNIIINALYNHYTKVPIYEKINNVRTRVGSGTRLQINQSLGIGFTVN